MSFDLDALKVAVAKHGRVVRVVVAGVKGSAPRGVGASMLIWPGGQSGTIGGGALELQAAEQALRSIANGDWAEHFALGPALGQCCGGAVTLIGETYDNDRLQCIEGEYVLRRINGQPGTPLPIKKQLQDARNSGTPVTATFTDGWVLEPVTSPTRHLWVYGAGHVGRALISVLSPFGEVEITWVDTSPDRYPDQIARGVKQLVAQNPADVVKFAPPNAEHLVLTYSHALDLEICHQLLRHGFHSAGLIGSATKWARFQTKLQNLGHSAEQIDRITCPIGRPDLGKHPQAIAVGVAARLLSSAGTTEKLLKRVG